MPNIEIHGHEPRSAQRMKQKIRLALKDSPDADEIVTTVYPTDVEDLAGKKSPFLRVISSLRELPDLLERLEPLKEDVEVMLLHKWIPKRV